jgi:hypothetical protein
VGHVAHMGEESVQGFGGGSPKEGDPGVDGIRMDFSDIVWGGGVDSVGSGDGSRVVVNAVMNLQVLAPRS